MESVFLTYRTCTHHSSNGALKSTTLSFERSLLMILSRWQRGSRRIIPISILNRRRLSTRSWNLPTTTGESCFSFLAQEAVERPTSPTPLLPPFVHKARSPFVSLLPL